MRAMQTPDLAIYPEVGDFDPFLATKNFAGYLRFSRYFFERGEPLPNQFSTAINKKKQANEVCT